MSKKLLLTILAIVLSACVLVSAVLIGGALTLAHGRLFSPAATATPTVESAIPQSIDSQMDEIQQQVLSYRGLKLVNPLKRALLSTSQLKDHVINEFFNDYTAADAKKDTEELSAFGLLPANFDLHDFYVKLYSEQIAGYYDSKTKDMYVVSDEGFNGNERMTYAHEFTHVLQDQAYDLENGMKFNEDYCKNETEYCAAVQALIEGDATLSEQYWYYKFSTDLDKKQIADFQQSYTSPVYDSAPAYMKDDFLFPYQYGLEFVNALYGENKWQSIDDAFKSPPVSTEQIMHPEKYPSDKPVKVTVPDLLSTLGSGWTEVDRNVMGEWYTYLVLADGRDASFRLDTQTAKDAAAGWGGDTYVYYSNDAAKQFVLVWESQWDTANDSDQFWQASRTYGNDRWGTASIDSGTTILWDSATDGAIGMSRSGNTVTWILAPSRDMESKLAGALKAGGK